MAGPILNKDTLVFVVPVVYDDKNKPVTNTTPVQITLAQLLAAAAINPPVIIP